MHRAVYSLLVLSLLTLSACGKTTFDSSQYPQSPEDVRKGRHGKITGEDGWVIFGEGSEKKSEPGTALGVNSFLWRATLDTLAFMPIATADPFGGVITTDWYENPEAPGERMKVNVLILDKTLRADGVKVTLFKQLLDKGNWRDTPVNPKVMRDLEDTILTRARELRMKAK